MDREKVINGLREMSCRATWKDIDRIRNKFQPIINGAIDLLKEQEAKPMIENELGWNCRSCGMKLIGKTASGYPCDLIDLPEDEPIHFCPMCGQAVKWDE